MTAGTSPLTGVRRRALLRAGVAAAAGGALTALAASPGHAAWPTVSLGSSGAHVAALQGHLAARGYWVGTPDGYFGALTEQAVWALQKSAGLSPDAVVGRQTLLALSHWVQPPVHGAGDGTRVVVDLERQVLTIIRDGALSLILNTSTGNGEPYDWYGTTYTARTRPGEFEVYQTYTPGWQTGPLGRLYRPQYFNGGIAVHGSDYIPPYPDSHGCCRVSVAAMDMLWEDTMEMGTPVLVV